MFRFPGDPELISDFVCNFKAHAFLYLLSLDPQPSIELTAELIYNS
jgi:hypothetical protein